MAAPTVVVLGGTGETYDGDRRTAPAGMLEFVTRHLPGHWSKVWVPYPAVYAQGVGGYGASREAGVVAAARAVDAAPGAVYLIGFSQGAASAGDLARRIALLQYPRLSLSGVGLLADPMRHRDQGLPGQTSGWGIGGERFIPTDRFPVWQLAAPGDPICRLPAGNPLRSLADLSEYYAPGGEREWFRQLRLRAEGNRWQKWWNPANVASWFGAIAWAKGYLVDGRHACYDDELVPGQSLTWCELLADLIIEAEEG